MTQQHHQSYIYSKDIANSGSWVIQEVPPALSPKNGEGYRGERKPHVVEQNNKSSSTKELHIYTNKETRDTLLRH